MSRIIALPFFGALLPLIGMAQLRVSPTETLHRPAGRWADSVLVSFNPEDPLAIVRRVNSMGEQRTLFVIFDGEPSHVIEPLLGPGLVPFYEDSVRILKVNRIRSDEVGPISSCNLHAEVITRQGGTLLRSYEATVGVSGSKCGKDEACHEQNLVRALQSFLDGFALAKSRGELGNEVLSEADLSAPFVVEASNSAILRVDAPKRGLYRTYMQMRMDQPDTLNAIELREAGNSLGDGHMVKLKHIPEAVVDEYWGLSDGSHAYVRWGKSFLRLERAGTEFFTSVPQPDTQDATAAALGGLFFGLIGGVVLSVATATSNPPIICDLDLLTGDLVPRSRDVDSSSYAQNIFLFTRYAKGAEFVTIQCELDDTTSLAKGQWTNFKFPPRSSPIKIEIKAATGSEVVQLDTNTDQVSVYLIDVKRDGELTVNELGEQMRNSVIRDLKGEDER
ncbi:MAG: hypothetical protein JNJ91_01330 [Flavobacteriales bacterium]|nr:hypothetical protein [Flavobacteriales bacterium]